MKFKDWIEQFKHVDSPLGDLAFDISRDKRFPESNDPRAIQEYLARKTKFGCQEVIRTFRAAWRIYESEV